ncbi:hypothetical protein [Nocardioides pacificus]
MVRISCPICSGPLEVRNAQVPDFEDIRPPDPKADAAVQKDVAQALRAALRALEDQAAGARWRLSEPDPPPLLAAQLAQARHHIELLHALLRDR